MPRPRCSGTALSVKPILHVVDGAIVVREKVRTASRALARLVDIAVAAAGDGDVDVAVHHLAAEQRATDVADALATRLGERLRDSYVQELDAVVAAHVGPGGGRRGGAPAGLTLCLPSLATLIMCRLRRGALGG